MIVADSVTNLPAAARDAVLLSGSHGGICAAYLAARAGVRAVILNDAGVECDSAGKGGLPLLDTIGMAAATLSHCTARIGDAEDGHRRGRISHVTRHARTLGVEAGMKAAEAVALLHERAPRRPAATLSPTGGIASIGYGVPLMGDGGFNMSLRELETARRVGASFVAVVLNNAASGHVKALQHSVNGSSSY